jgi:hypothetical protein
MRSGVGAIYIDETVNFAKFSIDGECHQGYNEGKYGPNTGREGLGGDNTYLERVLHPDGDKEGCLQYDSGHSRGWYRLDIFCCKHA